MKIRWDKIKQDVKRLLMEICRTTIEVSVLIVLIFGPFMLLATITYNGVITMVGGFFAVIITFSIMSKGQTNLWQSPTYCYFNGLRRLYERYIEHEN